MRRFAILLGLALLPALPALGHGTQLQPLVPRGPQVDPDAGYTPPKADGPVAVLLDEGVAPLFPVLVNDGGGEAGTITREERDVFAGVEAVRVTPMQKYRTRIPGWSFKIVENPKNAGEFRHVRLAWKKL